MKHNNINGYRGVKISRIRSGLILIIIGVLLLAYKMGAPIPSWLFTWPVLLIGIGILSGFKSRFQNPGSFIMILIGFVFLADQSIPGIDLHNYIVPAILIGIGIVFIFRPRSTCEKKRRYWNNSGIGHSAPSENENMESGYPEGDNAEYINVQAVFGGIKKNIQSKNFKGGGIISFMGGSEINFMQADILHPIVLEVNNVFGGTKLIIPANWDVKNEISAIFGGVEDKRSFQNSIPDPDKKILLKGSCIFGGIEVTNY